jgi:hypothetical protein
MLAEDDGDRGQLRDLMARRLADGATLRLAEAVAAGAALGPVVDELVKCRDGRQMTTASRMARLGAAPAPRGCSLPALRRGRWILAGGQRGVARVAVQAPLQLGDALLLLGEAPALARRPDAQAEHSGRRVRGAQRRPLHVPAHRSPQPRRAPCPRASRRRGEGLPMLPRRSSPQWRWVDQLNAYRKR